jgi:hypothetical protein
LPTRKGDAHARYVVLAHLSENNNNPTSREFAKKHWPRTGTAAFCGELIVASQDTPLPTLDS